MDVLAVVIAGWLFAGRAVMLSLIALTCADFRRNLTPLFAFTAGLVATPLIAACFSLTSFAFTGTLVALATIDVLAFLWLVGRIRRYGIRLSGKMYGLLLWTATILVLSWLNGPLIEHLSDAWWHMRNVSHLLHQNTLLLPQVVGSRFGEFRDLLVVLGADYSSYRLQAILAWLIGGSVVDSWIASTVAVSGVLAVSVYLLFHYLRLDRFALFFSLLFWLYLLGGMNTGVRLTGWPAGMGYAFLNIGLIASYRLYCDIASRSAWLLLSFCIAGSAFFHLAEVFLLAIALTSLFIGRVLFIRVKLLHSLLILGSVGSLLFVLFLPVADSDLATLPALLLCGAMLSVLWLIGVMSTRTQTWATTVLVCLVTCLCGYLVIDWHHVSALFQPPPQSSSGYYDGYIPQYLKSWDDRYYLLPRWEHQLRASLLWSGVTSLLMVTWLFFLKQSRLNTWLLVLTITPWMILISPGLFTLISSYIPIYGTYRVQFLIPVALGLGIATATACRQLSRAYGHSRNHLHTTNPLEQSAKNSIRAANTIKAVCFLIGAASLYLAALQLLGNFTPTQSSLWFWVPLLGVGLLVACGALSLGSAVSCAVLILCVGAAYPDFGVRTGLVANRPWAIHSNLAFHWRMTNNRDALRTHTALRYQNDLASIQKLTTGIPSPWFVSDMATSYYTAAETQLRPLVQQAHHSNSGIKHNKLLHELCDAKITGAVYLEQLKRLVTRQGQSVASSTRYMIVNHDTRNFTAEVLGTSCVGETDALESALMSIAQPIFKGEYLTLWKLD